MEVTLGLLADYANVTRDGKLNIMGVFDRANVKGFPGLLHACQLVLHFEAQYIERDRPHKVEVKLQDPDGQPIFEITGQIVVRGGEPGEVIGINQVIRIANLPLPRAGGYTFGIFVDDDLKSTVPLTVGQAPAAGDAQQELLPDG